MKKRIFLSMCGISTLCVLLACLCLTGVLYKFSYDNMRDMVRDESAQIAAALNNRGSSGLMAAPAASIRITLADPDGTVVYDSQEDAAQMENHADRPEVTRALQTGAAEARRYSETLTTQTFYRAVRLQNGQVVRVSADMDSVWVTALNYIPYILLVLMATVVFSAVSANFLAKRISTPLNNVDLDHPLSNDLYEELSPMLRRMERQRMEIRRQMEEMEEKRREFSAITSNMREGLVLLGKEGEILSINSCALISLGFCEEGAAGTQLLHRNREEVLRRTVTAGLEGTPGEAVLSRDGREYQLLCSPVMDGNEPNGAVLLLLDVTEKLQAGQMRREFTANVSHELKTPLTSISGFAEIIMNGIVKQEDVPQFAARIYNEAQRMIALVDDILLLSRLDEKTDADVKEQVPLLPLCRSAAERFRPLAEKRDVSIEVAGDDAEIRGEPRILEELVGNLCDNAIKYNNMGGTVRIEVQDSQNEVVLTVSDTGIGIPREHHARVFERFYRVDKSHSKETGGTGLGLSIVKHGALFHNARLELESEEGTGTVIQVFFPKTKN